MSSTRYFDDFNNLGAFLAKTPAQPIIIGFMFFLSGTRLKTEEVKNLIHHKLVLYLFI